MVKFIASEIAEWCGGVWTAVPQEILGVSIDTRTMNPGALFVAIKGAKYDGHDFVQEALRKGAGGIVVDKLRKELVWDQGNFLQVDNPAKALRDIALGYRRKIKPEVIGITGSAGKSTVKELTAAMLRSAGKTACTRGNWNNDIGLPLSILGMDADTRIGVFEMGTNHRGEINGLCAILEPDWGVITNIGPVHLEYLGSMDGVAEEKAGLLKCLPRSGAAVLDRDDVYYEYFARNTSARIVSISAEGNADYTHRINEKDGCVEIVDAKKNMRFELSVKEPGRHNILNSVLAAAIAREHGLEPPMIQKALNEFRPLPMRWEEKSVEGITLINDAYNANPLSMKAAIGTFHERHGFSGKWLVLGGMFELGERERSEHFEIGRYLAGMNWTGVLLVGELGTVIAEGVKPADGANGEIITCKTNSDALETLSQRLQNGDAVLFKGSRGAKLEEIVNGLVSKLTKRAPYSARA